MSADASDWTEDYIRDAVIDARQDAEHRYETSELFIADALMWVADHGHEDILVVAVATAAYRQSDRYTTRIDDIMTDEFAP